MSIYCKLLTKWQLSVSCTSQPNVHRHYWDSEIYHQQTATSVKCGGPSGRFHEQVQLWSDAANTRQSSLAPCASEHQVQTVCDDALMPGRHCSMVSGVPVFKTASRQHLHLAASRQLTVPSYRRITYGGQAFAVAGPMSWNSWSKRLHDSYYNTSVFGRLFKSFLFSQYYCKCIEHIRGFGDDVLYKSTFYITLQYILKTIQNSNVITVAD